MPPNDKPVLTTQQEAAAEHLEQRARGVRVLDVQTGLCFSCKFSHIYRVKHKASDYNVFCTYGYEGRPQPMPSDIDFCNKYERQGTQSFYDMTQSAIIVEGKPKHAAGFKINEPGQHGTANSVPETTETK